MSARAAPEQLAFWPLDAEPTPPPLPLRAAAARWFRIPASLCRLWLAELPCPRHGTPPPASPHGPRAASAGSAPCWYEAGRQIGLEPERSQASRRSAPRLLPHEMESDAAERERDRAVLRAKGRAYMRARHPKLYEEVPDETTRDPGPGIDQGPSA